MSCSAHCNALSAEIYPPVFERLAAAQNRPWRRHLLATGEHGSGRALLQTSTGNSATITGDSGSVGTVAGTAASGGNSGGSAHAGTSSGGGGSSGGGSSGGGSSGGGSSGGGNAGGSGGASSDGELEDACWEMHFVLSQLAECFGNCGQCSHYFAVLEQQQEDVSCDLQSPNCGPSFLPSPCQCPVTVTPCDLTVCG